MEKQNPTIMNDQKHKKNKLAASLRKKYITGIAFYHDQMVVISINNKRKLKIRLQLVGEMSKCGSSILPLLNIELYYLHQS